MDLSTLFAGGAGVMGLAIVFMAGVGFIVVILKK